MSPRRAPSSGESVEGEEETPAPELPLLVGPAATLPVQGLPGVGAKRAAVLVEAGVRTVADLLGRIPRRYLDRSRIVPIAEAPAGEEVTLIAAVRTVKPAPPMRRGRRGPPHTVDLVDETGSLRCVWFQGGRYHTFEPGDIIALSGRIEVFRGQRQMPHPEYEFVDAGQGEAGLLHTGGVIPLYASSAELSERGLRSRGFRTLVRAALEAHAASFRTQLPAGAEARHDLPGLADALWMIFLARIFHGEASGVDDEPFAGAFARIG